MMIVTVFYEATRQTEHWMIVPEWKWAYRAWNDLQGRLAAEKGIEPLWVGDIETWNNTWSRMGKILHTIGEPSFFGK